MQNVQAAEQERTVGHGELLIIVVLYGIYIPTTKSGRGFTDGGQVCKAHTRCRPQLYLLLLRL